MGKPVIKQPALWLFTGVKKVVYWLEWGFAQSPGKVVAIFKPYRGQLRNEGINTQNDTLPKKHFQLIFQYFRHKGFFARYVIQEKQR